MSSASPSGSLVPGTVNFRDVGGLTAGSAVVRHGRLFRSDALHSLGETGRAAVRGLGVRTVIDLRDEAEVTAEPDELDGLDLTIVHDPVLEGSAMALVAQGADLAILYRHMTEESGAVLTRCVAQIAHAAEGGVVVHCTAGKDRTGIVVALTLAAVGVDRADIVRDYAATEQNLVGAWLDGMVERASHHGITVDDAIRELIGGSPATAIEAVLDEVAERSGSAAGFLRAHGLSDDDLIALRRTLLVESVVD
jgi:protein-tyrosine phosphatase